MTVDEFTTGLRRLRVAFSKQPFSSEERDILYAEVSFIPAAAWPDVVSTAVERWESWPKNFARSIKELWYTWRRGRATKEDPEPCRYCSGRGFLTFRFFASDLDGFYTAACACGHCRNYRLVWGEQLRDRPASDGSGLYTIKRLTLEQIQAQGYELVGDGEG